MTKLATLIFSAIIFVSAPSLRADLLFYDDCENQWSLDDWKPAGEDGKNSLTVSTEKARKGKSSYKFVLAPYGTSGTDTNVELILRAVKNKNGNSNFDYDKDYWMGFSLYIPSDFKAPIGSGSWGSIGQFHATPDSCDDLPQTQPFGIQLKSETEGGGLQFNIASKDSYCGSSSYDRRLTVKTDDQLRKGQWNDIVAHFKFSYAKDGVLQIWFNGKLILDDKGINAMNDAKGPYFKLGFYAHSEEYMIGYYDEFKVGDANSSYDEVAPSGTAVSGSDSTDFTLNPPTLSIAD